MKKNIYGESIFMSEKEISGKIKKDAKKYREEAVASGYKSRIHKHNTKKDPLEPMYKRSTTKTGSIYGMSYEEMAMAHCIKQTASTPGGPEVAVPARCQTPSQQTVARKKDTETEHKK